MIAEALNPAVPAPDVPVAVVTEGNTDADVRARFRQAMEPKPEVNVQDISTAKNPVTGEAIIPKDKTPEKKVEGKTDGKVEIPDEFFGETSQEDEFDKLMKEEVKGQVKNENFKRFKDATAAKVAKLTKELEETRGKLPKDDYVPEKTAKQLEALQKRRDELEELVNRKYVEESPEFKEKFTTEREAVVKGLNRLGKDLGVPEDVIHQLVNSSPKRQIEILDGLDLSSNASSRINALLEQHEQINEKQADYLSDWKARQGEIEESRRASEDKEKAKIKGLYEKAFNDVLESVKDHELFKKRGNEKYDRETEELIEEARKIFWAEDSTPHKDAEVFISAMMTRRANAMLEKATELYRSTKKELDELKAAGPGGGHGSETSREDPTKNMSPDERAKWTYNQALATARNGY